MSYPKYKKGGAVAKEIKEACSYGNSTRLSTINSVKKNNITMMQSLITFDEDIVVVIKRLNSKAITHP